MSKAKKHKAIFFDAGGTLLYPHPSVGEIYARASAPYGVKGKPEVLEQEFYEAWQRRGGLASLGEETNEEKEKAWWHSLVREVFHSHGGVPNFDHFFESLYHSFERAESWAVYPEVFDVLRMFREHGWVLGVISNWDLRLPRVLKNLKLAPHFDFVVGSSAIGATKPSLKIFQEALTRAKAAPHEAVHVGDNYEEDFLGAQAAGIAAFFLDRKGNHGQRVSMPKEAHISSLQELCIRLLSE